MSDYPAIGAMVGVTFGLGWAVAGGAHLTAPRRRGGVVVASLLISSLLLAALYAHARRPHPASPGSFDGLRYGLAVALESCAIPLVAVACRRSRHPERLLPAVAGIVGLHFLGLAYALGRDGWVFVWVAVAMSTLAAVALWRVRVASANFWAAAVGLGCALILWLSASSVLW